MLIGKYLKYLRKIVYAPKIIKKINYLTRMYVLYILGFIGDSNNFNEIGGLSVVDYGNQSRTTGIEWASHTWNPFVGCSIKSAGCTNCYAMSLAKRLDLMGQNSYAGTWKDHKGKTVWSGKLNQSSKATLDKPKKIRDPSIIFVNSMSDFFHADAKDEWRLNALETMAETPRHQYQVLTKRPENIEPFLKRHKLTLPKNVWIGATVESRLVVDRIKMIQDIPDASIKFLSIEPLIGDVGEIDLKGIDWVITGGESGWYCRPMEFDWLNGVHIQTREQRVKHFFKQYGHWKNNPLSKEAETKGISPGSYLEKHDPIGKGGSKINGVYYKEMPKNYEVANYE